MTAEALLEKSKKNLLRGSSRKLLFWTCSRGSKNAGRGSFAEGSAEGSPYVHLKYEGIKTKTHIWEYIMILYAIRSQYEDRAIGKLGCHMSKRCAWRRSAQRARWKMMSQLTLWRSTLLDDFHCLPSFMGGKFYDTKWQQVKTSTAFQCPTWFHWDLGKQNPCKFPSCLHLSDGFFSDSLWKKTVLDQWPRTWLCAV